MPRSATRGRRAGQSAILASPAQPADVSRGFAVLLIALVALPAWHSAYSSAGFEPDKLWTWGILLAGGAPAFLPAMLQAMKSRKAIFSPDALALPLALGLWLLIMALAAAFSLHPSWSFWGAPQRGRGWLAVATGAASFGMAVALCRQAGGRRLLEQALLLGTLPVLVLALWQRLDLPLPILLSGDPFEGRPFATLGNPTFLGGYLVLVLPFTLRALGTAWLTQPAAGGPAHPRLWRAGLLLLGLCQVLVLVWTHCRGAWLGAAAGLLAAGMLGWMGRGRRRLALACLGGLALLLAGILALTWAADTPSPGVGRFLSDQLDPTGSGRQRLEIWKQTLALAQRSPTSRLLLGYGPDAQGLLLPNQLQYSGPRQADGSPVPLLLDRAHTLWLDLFLAGGLGAVAAALLLGLILFRQGLRALGNPAHPFLLAGGAMAGAAVFALPAVLCGAAQLVPLAAGLGLLAGAAVTGLISLWRYPCSLPSGTLACVAALLGHLVALQFGFETQTTALLAWVCAALWIAPDKPSTHAARPIHLLSRRLVPLATAAGLVALLPGLGTPAQTAWGLPLGAIWLLGGGVWMTQEGCSRLSAYPWLSLTPLLAAAVICRLTLPLAGWGAVIATTAALAALLACAGLLLPAPRSPAHSAPRRIVLALLGSLLLAAPFVRLAAGDVLVRQMVTLLKVGPPEPALALQPAALWLAPQDGPIYDAGAQAWTMLAWQAAGFGAVGKAYGQAIENLQAAWACDPLVVDYGRRIALVYMEWARRETSAQARTEHLQAARAALQQAVSLAPARTDLAALQRDVELVR